MNFLLPQVAELVAHARFLKSTILIKIGNVFVKWILKGRNVIKVLSRWIHTHTQTNFPIKLHKFITLLIARSMIERNEIQHSSLCIYFFFSTVVHESEYD